MMKQPDANENLTIALRRMHRWRMAFFGLVLMISGGILGAAVTLLVFRPAGPPSRMDPRSAASMMALRLKDELGLTEQQEEQIKAILQTHLQKLEEIRDRARPEIEAAMQSMEAKVSGVLSETQREQLQEIMDRMKREFQRGMRMGPGGPGGPGGRGGPGGFRDGYRDRDGYRQFRPSGEEGDGPPDGGPGWFGPRGRRGSRRRPDPNVVPQAPAPTEQQATIEPNEP